MRERVEDLGRICVLSDAILNLDVWDLFKGRNKDFVDEFRVMTDDDQDTLLHNFIYGLDSLKDKIEEISSIAEGNDRLNEIE